MSDMMKLVGRIAGPLCAAIGILFMAKCKTIFIDQTIKNPKLFDQMGDLNSKTFAVWAGVIAHYTFIQGALCWMAGMSWVGLDLGLDAQTAVYLASVIILVEVTVNHLKGMSANGAPGVMGPPFYLLIPLLLVLAVLSYPFFANYSGMVSADKQPTFLALLIVGLLVPRLISANLMQEDWLSGSKEAAIEAQKEYAGKKTK